MRMKTDKIVTCVQSLLLRLKGLIFEGGVMERSCVNRAPRNATLCTGQHLPVMGKALGKGEE